MDDGYIDWDLLKAMHEDDGMYYAKPAVMMGGHTTTGTLRLPQQTPVASPNITFQPNSNTGIYNVSYDEEKYAARPELDQILADELEGFVCRLAEVATRIDVQPMEDVDTKVDFADDGMTIKLSAKSKYGRLFFELLKEQYLAEEIKKG